MKIPVEQRPTRISEMLTDRHVRHLRFRRLNKNKPLDVVYTKVDTVKKVQ